MPIVEIRETVPAPAAAVFELLHDYRRRLEWDTLLSEAFLEPAFSAAAAGAISVCRGKRWLGGFALRTQYVSFRPGKVAAVKLLNCPPIFATFAATIRHEDEGTGSSVLYKANFETKPRVLRPILDPLVRMIFVWETRKRLRALKRFFESRAKNGDS